MDFFSPPPSERGSGSEQHEGWPVEPMITVLLIESEPAHLIGLALILRCFGYSVLEADSADEAVVTAKTEVEARILSSLDHLSSQPTIQDRRP